MTKKNKPAYRHVPCIVSTSELQRRAGAVINEVRESAAPYFVVRNNKPEAVILDIEEYEQLKAARHEWELADALDAIKDAQEAKKKGNTTELKGSVYKLWQRLQNEKDD